MNTPLHLAKYTKIGDEKEMFQLEGYRKRAR